MNRLTTDKPEGNVENSLNLFYIKDQWTWVRGYGSANGDEDISLSDLVRMMTKAIVPDAELPKSDDDLSFVMPEWLMFEPGSPEGIIALLYNAGWAFAELRQRLAAYEDTGLTPEEVENMRESKADAQFMLTELCKLCDYDRLCELAQADKDGKLVVVPCKVGDTVFDAFEAAENGLVGVIRETKVKEIYVHFDKRDRAWLVINGRYYEASDFGKTAFLNRKKAEKAAVGGADNA